MAHDVSKRAKHVLLFVGCLVVVYAATTFYHLRWKKPVQPAPDVAAPLESLQRYLSDRAQIAQTWEEQANKDKELISLIVTEVERKRGESKQDASALLMALKGLELNRQFLENDARLDQSSFVLLAGITRDILAGERYEKVDRELQGLETSFGQLDESIKEYSSMFDHLDALMRLAEKTHGSSVYRKELEVTRAEMTVQQSSTNNAVSVYEGEIKPVTEKLRAVVDKLAQSQK